MSANTTVVRTVLLGLLVFCLPGLHADGAGEVAIEGTVSAVLGDGSFQMLEGLITVDATGAKLKGLESPSAISAGMVLEVKGRLEAGDQLRAAKIEAEDVEDEDSLRAEIEGVIDQVAGDGSWFTIGGLMIRAGSLAEIREASELSIGQAVEALLEIEEGFLIATRVSVEDDED